MVDVQKFPIPSVIDPDKTRCIKLEIPDNDDWIRVFVGLLAQPSYWFNWQPNAGKNGRDLAQIWTKLYDKIDWSTMSCCIDPLFILNPDGSVSVSTDGGVTYHTDNSLDPRYQLPQFPPQVGGDVDSTKCKAANSIVRQMKDIQIGNSASIGSFTTVLAMATSLVGLAVLVFVDPALIPFLIGAFFELASALLVTTSAAYDALFSDDDWSWILCEIYCKLNDDGTFPASEFVNLQSDFDSHFSGNAALTYSSILNSWQLPGLNRAGAIPTTDNLDCGACSCVDGCQNEWSVYVQAGDHFGEILSQDGTMIHCRTTNINTNGVYYIFLITDDINNCCYINSMEVVSGTPNLVASDCGNAIGTGLGNKTAGCFNQLQPQGSAPFEVIFHIDACP